MFDIKKYKQFSLIQLKGRWRVSVLISLVMMVIVMLFQLPTIINSQRHIDYTEIMSMDTLDTLGQIQAISDISKSQQQRTGLSILQFLVTSILELAMVGVFIKMSKAPEHATPDNPGFECHVKFSDFIEGFSNWIKAISVGLWQGLWVFLWSLLFIIPGIVKSYSYSQMYFLACEYPSIPVTKLMDISKKITNGHKWDLFILDLSFIGWILLAGFTVGIGFLWLLPYVYMTKVNAYHALMKEAIERRVITAEDVQQDENDDNSDAFSGANNNSYSSTNSASSSSNNTSSGSTASQTNFSSNDSTTTSNASANDSTTTTAIPLNDATDTSNTASADSTTENNATDTLANDANDTSSNDNSTTGDVQ